MKFFTGFWKDACDEGGLAWDDSNNNRAFLSGTISATIERRVDLHRVAPEQGEVQDGHGRADAHRHPARGKPGPGRLAPTRYHTAFNHGVMSYSKNQKLAKDFIKWWYSKPQMDVWFTAQKGFAQGLTKTWESHPMWQQDPVMLPYRTPPASSGSSATPDPRARRRREAYSKYIIIDMYAKAIQGMSAEEAVKWAEGELKKIYGA